MMKKRAPMLICIVTLVLILTIVIFTAYDPLTDGKNTTGDTVSSDAGTDNIDKTDTENTEKTPGTTAQPLPTDNSTESAEPVEITVSLSETSVSLEAEKSLSLEIIMIPVEYADARMLTARVSDDSIVHASVSVGDTDAVELKISAVREGKASVEVFYGGVVSATVDVSVSAKPSGETKPLPPVQMPDEIDPSRPMLALTFDDGPGKYTSELLDILEKYNVHATFFVLGNMIGKREGVVKRTVSAGHEIGIHTWDHSTLTKLGKEDIRQKIMSVSSLLEDVAGYTPRLMRPPGGGYNDDVKAVCAEEGLLIVRWNVDTEDWKTRDSDATYNAIMKDAKDGAIILCHDIHEQTVAAMDRTIAALLNEGYQLVTVSELLLYSQTQPVAGDVVYSRNKFK